MEGKDTPEQSSGEVKEDPVQFDPSRMIGIIKRKALIKELASAYHAECRTLCQDLLQLQRKHEEEEKEERRVAAELQLEKQEGIKEEAVEPNQQEQNYVASDVSSGDSESQLEKYVASDMTSGDSFQYIEKRVAEEARQPLKPAKRVKRGY